MTEVLKNSLHMLSESEALLLENDAMIYSVGLSFVILIFGPLFAFILSHDVMNREIEQRTMRFIVTKVRRNNIVIGKVLGHLLFWFTILTAAYLLIFALSGYFSFHAFFESLSLLSVFVALALLLSLLINKPILSSFLSILLGIAIPIVSLWAVFSEKWYISIFKYISPYKYLQDDSIIFLVNFAFSAIYIGVAIYLFRKRDV